MTWNIIFIWVPLDEITNRDRYHQLIKLNWNVCKTDTLQTPQFDLAPVLPSERSKHGESKSAAHDAGDDGSESPPSHKGDHIGFTNQQAGKVYDVDQNRGPAPSRRALRGRTSRRRGEQAHHAANYKSCDRSRGAATPCWFSNASAQIGQSGGHNFPLFGPGRHSRYLVAPIPTQGSKSATPI